MDIRFDDRNQFAQLAKKFRSAGKNGAAVRKELTATIQRELKPVVQDIQSEARGMKVTGVRTGSRIRKPRSSVGGTLARERFDVAAEMRRQSSALAKGKKFRARRSHMETGLRARIAASVKSRVQYTGFRMGAKVYVETSNLPASQRKLPKHLNNPKGWRHPVYGNRRVWAEEHGEPYFTRPVERHQSRVRRSVADAVARVMRTLKT